MKRRSQPKSQGAKQHKGKVRCRTRESHQCGAVWMAPFPVGVVRGAGKADHSAKKQKAENWENHHAVRRTPDMRNGIQRHLAAEGCRFVSTKLGDQCVRRFMARGGE